MYGAPGDRQLWAGYIGYRRRSSAGHMYLIRTVFIGVSLTACAQNSLPEPFGVTMVEETTCIGQGGRIVVGPEGPFCAAGEE